MLIIGLPTPSGEWEEYEACAAKPGSPQLCDHCLERRTLCHRLQEHLAKQQEVFLKSWPFRTYFARYPGDSNAPFD